MICNYTRPITKKFGSIMQVEIELAMFLVFMKLILIKKYKSKKMVAD